MMLMTHNPCSEKTFRNQFLDSQLKIQMKLIVWLTKLTLSEPQSEIFHPTPQDIEGAKWASQLHYSLYQVMGIVYSEMYRDMEPYTVFVAHGGPDKRSYAMPLARHLRTRDTRTFIDRNSIRLGFIH